VIGKPEAHRGDAGGAENNPRIGKGKTLPLINADDTDQKLFIAK
jgi:hypothetical protein